MSEQREMDFNAGGHEAGYQRWLLGRDLAQSELVKHLNLPLGHEVEVWLRGGIRLRGRLQLKDQPLFVEENQTARLELRVNGVTFTYPEMESCVRRD